VDHMVPSALALGCAENASAIWDVVSDEIGSWPVLSTWYRAAVVNGLDGTGKGPVCSDGQLLMLKVLELIHTGLKDRGAGEEIFMEPVWERFHAGENPGQAIWCMYYFYL
jgi:hypothetical protein